MKAVSMLGVVGTVVLCVAGCSKNEPVATEPVVATETVAAEAELAAQNMTNTSDTHVAGSTESGNQTAEQKAGQDQQY